VGPGYPLKLSVFKKKTVLSKREHDREGEKQREREGGTHTHTKRERKVRAWEGGVGGAGEREGD